MSHLAIALTSARAGFKVCCALGETLVCQSVSNHEPIELSATGSSNLDAVRRVFRSKPGYSSALHFSSAHWGLSERTASVILLVANLDTQSSQLASLHYNLHFSSRRKVRERSRSFDHVLL